MTAAKSHPKSPVFSQERLQEAPNPEMSMSHSVGRYFTAEGGLARSVLNQDVKQLLQIAEKKKGE